MNKDYLLPGPKNKIRITRKVARVKAVPIAHAVHKLSHDHFRFGIGISDS